MGFPNTLLGSDQPDPQYGGRRGDQWEPLDRIYVDAVAQFLGAAHLKYNRAPYSTIVVTTSTACAPGEVAILETGASAAFGSYVAKSAKGIGVVAPHQAIGLFLDSAVNGGKARVAIAGVVTADITGLPGLTLDGSGHAPLTCNTTSGRLQLAGPTDPVLALGDVNGNALMVEGAAGGSGGSSSISAGQVAVSNGTNLVGSSGLTFAGGVLSASGLIVNTVAINPNFTPPSDGQALVYSNSNSAFIPQTLTGLTGSGTAGQIATWSGPSALTASSTLLFATGQLQIASSSGSVYINNSTAAAPTFTTLSGGNRVILTSSGVDASHAAYAIGLESGHIWFGTDVAPGVADSTHGFKFYAGTTQIARLANDGTFNALAGLQVGGVAVALSTIAISAGSGLSGGGNLTTNRTISMPGVGPGATTTGGSGNFILSVQTDAQGRVVALTTGVPTGSGTVTSVAMAVPGFLSVAGTPVTTAGTLAVTLATQSANLVFAGPASGGALAPTFRSLVTADFPVSGVTAATYGDATHVPQIAIDATGRVTTASNVAISGGGGGSVNPSNIGLRPTLQSGVSLSVTDQTGKTNVYLTPHRSQHISLYFSSAWVDISTAELTLALGTLTSGKNYDVWCSTSDGTTATLSFSAAWTSDTARADALGTQDGVRVKSGDATKRYVATIRTTSTTTTEDSALKRFLYSPDNQETRSLQMACDGTSHNYSTATFQAANANSANCVSYVRGLDEGVVRLTGSYFATAGATVTASTGIGIDSSTVNSALDGGTNINAAVGGSLYAHYAGNGGGLGYHTAILLEKANTGTTTTWYTNFVATSIQITAGIVGTVQM